MIQEKNKLLLLLLLFIVFTFILSLLSAGTYDTGDSISHFQIAQFAFQHPENFLNLWGKPVFTLFAAPFAQFGFHGISFFNILCAASTAWIGNRIIRKSNNENHLLVLPFILFNPLYFVCLFSGLTEIFFGFVTMLSIYLFSEKKFKLSAFVISFLPFIRSEGFLFLPIISLLLLYRKQWKAIPLLFAGTLLVGIAGAVHSGNLLWLLQTHPYVGGHNVYGHGAWNHFLRKNEFILGLPLVIFFILGVIHLIYSGISKAKKKNQNSQKFIDDTSILVYTFFIIYFIAHSIFWWKGIFASAGLIRVMAGVAPLAGMIAFGGFNFVLQSFGEKRVLKNSFRMLVCLALIWMPFKQHAFPRPLDYEQKQVKAAADYIQSANLANRKMYFLYPYFSYAMNLDPFDNQMAVQLWSIHSDKLNEEIPIHSIVIWDSHFSPQEGKIPFKNLSDNPHFKLLKNFSAAKDELFFEVFVFEKVGE